MICGLDISTTCIGITILNDDGSIALMDHLDFDKRERDNIWQMADKFNHYLTQIPYKINHLAIEEPKKSFAAGKSSSNTLIKLIQFNAICSHIARLIFQIDPVYISEATARKQCGVILSKSTISYKEQTFLQLKDLDIFSNHKWEQKRTGKYKEHNLDMMDSYVVAHSAAKRTYP